MRAQTLIPQHHRLLGRLCVNMPKNMVKRTYSAINKQKKPLLRGVFINKNQALVGLDRQIHQIHIQGSI